MKEKILATLGTFHNFEQFKKYFMSQFGPPIGYLSTFKTHNFADVVVHQCLSKFTK